MLATKLDAPISWQDPDPDIAAFLDQLQGNILGGHGRNHVVYLFCRFRHDLKPEALAFLRAQIARVQAAKHRRLGADPFVSIFLSRSGYDYLGIPHARQPPDHAFQGGMAAARLGDPPQATWPNHLRNPHALILIALDSPQAAQTEATHLLHTLAEIGDVPAGQSGAIIDHTPSPATPVPPDQLVVPDPAAPPPYAYGSYFVLRQLEPGDHLSQSYHANIATQFEARPHPPATGGAYFFAPSLPFLHTL